MMDWLLNHYEHRERARMFCQRTRRIAGFAASLAMAMFGCLIGCEHTPRGKLPRGDVKVAITYGSEPVTEGMVDFSNLETGEGGGAFLNANGIATLVRVVEGNYVVAVNPPHPNLVIPGQPASAVKKKVIPNIPEKFRDFATSPLRADVKEGETGEYRFDLKQFE